MSHVTLALSRTYGLWEDSVYTVQCTVVGVTSWIRLDVKSTRRRWQNRWKLKCKKWYNGEIVTVKNGATKQENATRFAIKWSQHRHECPLYRCICIWTVHHPLKEYYCLRKIAHRYKIFYFVRRCHLMTKEQPNRVVCLFTSTAVNKETKQKSPNTCYGHVCVCMCSCAVCTV